MTIEYFEKQHFEFILNVAVERFNERLVQRCEGAENGLAALRADPEGDNVWLSRFVDAFFTDMLLDNTPAACFILEALEKRTVSYVPDGKISQVVLNLAKQAFKALLLLKAQEALEQSIMYPG